MAQNLHKRLYYYLIILACVVMCKGSPMSESSNSRSTKPRLELKKEGPNIFNHQSKAGCMCPEQSHSAIKVNVPFIAIIKVMFKTSEPLALHWTIDTYSATVLSITKNSGGKLKTGKIIKLQSISENPRMNFGFCGYDLKINKIYRLSFEINRSMADNFTTGLFYFDRCYFPKLLKRTY